MIDNPIEYDTTIEQLGFSVRTYNTLHRAGIRTVGQIYTLSDAQLLRIRNLGKSSLNEIRRKLQLPAMSKPIPRWSLEQQKRQSRAYDLLIGIEEGIRRFIHHGLIKAFAQNWLVQGIPESIRQKANERIGKNDESVSASDYLRHIDFGDYKTIILQPGNWQEVFSSRLGNESEVKEHLNTINTFRRSIAHARTISDNDLKSLESEAGYVTRKFRIRKDAKTG